MILKSPLKYLVILSIALGIGLLSNIEVVYKSVFGLHSVYPIVDIINLLIILVLGIILVYFLSPKVVLKIILFGFLLRIIVMIAIAIFGILPYAFDTQWHEISLLLLEDWKQGFFNFETNTSTNVKYYTLLTTFVYFIFGYNPIYMMFINVIFGTLTLIYVYKLALYLFNNNKVANISLIFMTIWPTHLMFSAMHMRDALSTFLIILIMYTFIKWMKTFEIKYIFLSLLCLVLNGLIREQNALLNLASIAPFFIYLMFKKSNKFLKPIFLQVSVVLMFIIIIIFGMSGFLDKVNLDYFIREMSWRTNGEAAYLEWMTYGSWFDIILYSPIRVFYFMYTPFLWNVTDLPQLLSFFESSFLLILSIYIFLKFRKVYKSSEQKIELLFILTFLIIGITANAAIDSNIGTAVRHKLQYLPIVFMLFSYCYVNKYKKAN